MKTIALTFHKNMPNGKDEFQNDTFIVKDIVVLGCLIAPITEPQNAREVDAMKQQRLQVRIHLPKDFAGDVGDSTVEWGGRTFRVDSDSVAFMTENCPTNWNRYFRAEAYDE